MSAFYSNRVIAKNKNIIILCFISLLCLSSIAQTKTSSPHLEKQANSTQLYVNDKPFFIMGGELGNSSASSREFMKPVWSKLVTMGLNTVVMPVYWELIEPEENKFDFTLVDSLISDASEHNLHLVLLWFGTWKNSMSCYVPEWIKTNTKQFPRITGNTGRSMEIVSAFSKEALTKDSKAFATVMKHIKETDAAKKTVIMVQVENEVGIIGASKETSAEALNKYNSPVPEELMHYLQNNKNQLDSELKETWSEHGYKSNGTWQQVFGNNPLTDELFQAYYFASYVNEVAAADKAEYNIPFYVNAALIKPVYYRSAGPVPPVSDIWKMAAPNIDMLSPDFYNSDTKYWCDLYSKPNNPLFIPEIRFDSSDGAKALYIAGHYHSLGFSPFSIENGNNKAIQPLQNSYHILNQLYSFITKDTSTVRTDGVLFDKKKQKDTLLFGKYVLIASHDNTLGWNGHKQDSLWDVTGAMIIQTAPDEFIVGGTGVVINFSCTDTAYNTGIVSIEKGEFKDEIWQSALRLNGDEDHQGRHLRIPLDEWNIQRVKLYEYK